MKYTVRAALAVFAGLLASVLSLSAASATTLPKIQANDTGWSGMVTRPGSILLSGIGGALEANHLTWSRWTTTGGKATGKLDLFWCAVYATCQPTVKNVTVWANTVRTHMGSPYFAHLVYQYVNAKGVTKQLRYWFYTYPGASVPGWH